MSKKILINANAFFTVWNFRQGLVEELKNKGYEVKILAVKDGYEKEIQKKGWNFESINMDRRGKNFLEDFKLLKNYIKIFSKESPDYILNFTIKPNIYGSIAAHICKIKTINNVTGLGDVFNKETFITKIVKKMYKVSFRYPKKVFFQNDDDLELFLSNNLIDKKNSDRLPGSGVNLEKFKPLKKEYKDAKFKFLFLGRINENKGVRLINEVSKKLKIKYPNIEFQLLGKIYLEENNHISEQELKRWEKESNIKYLGTSNDVRQEIKECDCVLFPSYYREGVPRSLIESAAMGKPIITTDNVGCRDIVKDGYNGFLAKPKSLDSLIEQVEKILSLTENELYQLGMNGRLKVEKEFDEKIVIQKYIDAIEN